MSQQVQQNVASSIIVLLSKTSLPVTGLVFSDVTASFRKEGGVFAAKTLTALNFHDRGSGVYEIDFTTAELNTVGSLTVVVQGLLIDQSTTVAEVVAAGSIVPGTEVAIQTCVLTGHVTNLSGVPQANVAVSAEVLGMPSIEQSQAAIINEVVATKTDANGQFFLELARLADVEIFIPAVNYRRRLVVPNTASANLFFGIP